MSLVVGALKSIWSAHVVDHGGGVLAPQNADTIRTARMKAIDEHETLYRCIVAGDAAGAEKAAREHFPEALERKPQGWQNEFDLDAIVNVDSPFFAGMDDLLLIRLHFLFDAVGSAFQRQHPPLHM